MQANKICAGIIVGIVVLVVLSFVLKVCYNHAVVDGLSKDPHSGKSRLAPIDFEHAFFLYLLLTLFIAPCAVVTTNATYAA